MEDGSGPELPRVSGFKEHKELQGRGCEAGVEGLGENGLF